MEEFLTTGLPIDDDMKIVFIGPLAHNCTYKVLKNYLNSIIDKYELLKSKNKGKNKNCHAILKLPNEQDYLRMMIYEHNIMGKKANVKDYLRTNTQTEQQSLYTNQIDRRVYFWNLEFLESSLTENDLQETFSKYGEVKQVYFNKTQSEGLAQAEFNISSNPQERKTYGFVTFANSEIVENTLNYEIVECQGTEIHINSLTTFIKMIQLISNPESTKLVLSSKYRQERDQFENFVENNKNFQPESQSASLLKKLSVHPKIPFQTYSGGSPNNNIHPNQIRNYFSGNTSMRNQGSSINNHYRQERQPSNYGTGSLLYKVPQWSNNRSANTQPQFKSFYKGYSSPEMNSQTHPSPQNSNDSGFKYIARRDIAMPSQIQYVQRPEHAVQTIQESRMNIHSMVRDNFEFSGDGNMIKSNLFENQNAFSNSRQGLEGLSSQRIEFDKTPFIPHPENLQIIDLMGHSINYIHSISKLASLIQIKYPKCGSYNTAKKHLTNQTFNPSTNTNAERDTLNYRYNHRLLKNI